MVISHLERYEGTLSMSRLPKLNAGELDNEQRRIVDEITAGPRGEVRGPFIPLLHNAKAADAVQRMGAFLRFEGTLPGALREMVILLVARHWCAQYEWFAHHDIALSEGLAPGIADAIQRNATPAFEDPLLERVYQFVIELHRNHEVSRGSFDLVLESLGPAKTVELVALCGHYNTVAMVLNTFSIEPPGGENPLKKMPD